jgi:hypothetical protein
MSSPNWIILTLDPTTDEADLRRVLANKLKGQYLIRFKTVLGKIVVAVTSSTDAKTVQESFDVIDKQFSYFFDGVSVRDHM